MERELVGIARKTEEIGPLPDQVERQVGKAEVDFQCRRMAAPFAEALAKDQRIVSEPLEGKGRQRFIGCGPEGRVGLALQEKHRTPQNERFFTLRRGDVIRITQTEPKGDGLSLGEASEVTVLAPAGRRVPEHWE